MGAGIFDEIVVVDTGGADRAVEIGRLPGAKAAKIARTKNLQSSLPSCHLRGNERELRAIFVERRELFVLSPGRRNDFVGCPVGPKRSW